MNPKQLMIQYPGTVVKKQPFLADRGAMYFFEDPYYIAIPLRKLTDGERAMIETLFRTEEPPQISGNAVFWYEQLIEGKSIGREDPTRHVRFIHFQLDQQLTGRVMNDWRQALESFFDKSAAFIYLSSTKGLIIEQGTMLEDEMVRAIADMLENDFSVKTHFLIGLRYPVSPLLRQVCQDEDELFRLETVKSKAVARVESDILIGLAPYLHNRPITSQVRALVASDRSWVKIIRALWANEGNVSLTAKKLYMHRNTLQYRMDKFFESTGICLKRMDGLAIAYLSIV